MRVIFFGTPEFSVPVLTALIRAGHEVVLVVTQPDKPKGRGKEMQVSPVKAAALAAGLPVFQPKRLRDEESVAELCRYSADVGVVVAYGQILPASVLNHPANGCINVHASLLPMYRGAAPIQQVILDGCKETGITTMQMDEGLDTGDMLLRQSLAIAPDETGGSLHDKLSVLGAQLLIETLSLLQAGTLTRVPQQGETCYAGMIKKQMGLVDWNASAVEIERLVRGMNPWPSAFTHRGGKTLKLWQAQALSGPGTEAEPGCNAAESEYNAAKPECNAAEPGCVTAVHRDAVDIQTGEGILRLLSVQPEGKKRMEVDAYLRGYPVSVGERLG